MTRSRTLLLGTLLAAGLLAAARAESDEAFLLHLSDTHLPVPGNEATIRATAEVVSRAHAIVVTGDLTEFGGLEPFARFEKLFQGIATPVLPTLGNHDATWRSLHDVFWKRRGRPYYAEDAGAFRVIVLDSSTCQDPRPHFGPEELSWLEGEVARAAGRPLVLAFHHPPWGGEFASPWASARLGAALEGATVAAILAGHNHSSSTRSWSGHRVVVGGAAQGKNSGYTTIRLAGGRLEAVWHPNEGEPARLCDDAVAPPGKPARWEVSVVGSAVRIEARGKRKLEAQLVPGDRVPLEDGVATLPHDRVPGPRGVVLQEGKNGRLQVATVEVPGARRRWRRELGAGLRTRPVVLAGKLLVGTDAGELLALDPESGAPRGRVPTKGPVLATPVLAGERIVLASGDGRVRVLDAALDVVAELEVGAPVYGTPIFEAGRLHVFDLEGFHHVLDLEARKTLRRTRVAEGPIEAPALLGAGLVFQGAWDRCVHAIDLATGKERWAAESDGARLQKAKRYYSPADAPLALVGGVLAACDRDAKLTFLDAATGERRGGAADAWACAPIEGDLVVKGQGHLRRVRVPSGEVVWKTALRLGRTPAPPLVVQGEVWVSSDDGEVACVDAATGAIKRRERASPGELTLAPIGAHGQLVYVASLDGSLTALARD